MEKRPIKGVLDLETLIREHSADFPGVSTAQADALRSAYDLWCESNEIREVRDGAQLPPAELDLRFKAEDAASLDVATRKAIFIQEGAAYVAEAIILLFGLFDIPAYRLDDHVYEDAVCKLQTGVFDITIGRLLRCYPEESMLMAEPNRPSDIVPWIMAEAFKSVVAFSHTHITEEGLHIN